MEVSQHSEGLNIKMFQIQQGCYASLVLSGTAQIKRRMIEQLLEPKNMRRAYRKVLSNKGSAGVDGMSVQGLYAHLNNNKDKLESDIRQGKYLPQAIRGIEIPKSNGKTRLLGVPTVTDRMLQQALGQVLATIFEIEFEDFSYGFRPNRNAQQAVLKSLEYINLGYQHIVDIDL
jgi:RNA-directed DNA polymerase